MNFEFTCHSKFCCFGIFVFNFFVFVFIFFVLVLVFVNEFVIFSFFSIFVFVFVNENHADMVFLCMLLCIVLLPCWRNKR